MPDVDYHIFLNANSGTAISAGVTAERLDELFTALGKTISIDADQNQPFEQRLRRARTSPAPVIVAAGGDGTITALASVLADTEKTLAVLPLGTANLLARDLSIPLDLETWIAALGDMQPKQIDVGEVNGQVFLHKVVVGAVPGIAAGREQLRGRSDLGSTIAFLFYMVRRLARIRRFAAEISTDDGAPRIERVQSIAVANNDYAAGLGQIFTRSRLDAGTLSLCLVRHLRLRDALRLGAEMLLGTWRNDGVLEIENVREATIRTRRRTARAMIDGEVMKIDMPLRFRIRPLALTMLAPVPAADPAAATDETAEPLPDATAPAGA